MEQIETLSLLVSMVLLALTLLALWLGVRLYQLLRTGELGRVWRLIVFGVVLLTFREILRLGDQLHSVPGLMVFERTAETGFMALMCYALWKQWLTFDGLQRGRWLQAKRQQRLTPFARAGNQNQEPSEEPIKMRQWPTQG
ncbi:MAG: hypothetical protein NZ959_04380 [Armatimonadetes bacterium]|nr:hypothetical protein [Armatimonadota bacterium]MDW8121411.1 hypothetical protein [Armatimonadota bacterium]